MQEIDKVLNDNERILWQGRPQFLPYFIPIIFYSLFTLMILSVVVVPLTLLASTTSGEDVTLSDLRLQHFTIPIILLIWCVVHAWLSHKNVHYAITDKRVLIQSGIVGRDFKAVDFDKLTNVGVDVGLFDKIFGSDSGSITLSISEEISNTRMMGVQTPNFMEYNLANIGSPYEVFKFFKKISFDVKTDMNFPNKFRPADNPGYKTAYSPSVSGDARNKVANKKK
jgi:hypothetical protein